MKYRRLLVAFLLGTVLVQSRNGQADFKQQVTQKITSAQNYLAHKWFTPNDNDPRVAAIAAIGAAGSIMGIYKLFKSKKVSSKIVAAGFVVGFAALALGSKDVIAFYEKFKAANS